MLDLGLSKLAIIGVVALVVIGPEKLPRVARTAGALLGRAQRYINDVKAEVAREMDVADLKAAKSEFEDAARTMHSSVNEHVRETEASLREAGDSVSGSVRDAEQSLNDSWRTLSPDPAPGTQAALAADSTSAEATNPSGYSVYDSETSQGGGAVSPAVGSYGSHDGSAYGLGASSTRVSGKTDNARRVNWRVKQTASPIWYKRAQRVRTQLKSGAARVAQHRPEQLAEADALDAGASGNRRGTIRFF